MQNIVFFIGFIFSLLSLAVTVFIILLHVKLRSLLKHPGQYVFIQCICQLLYDLHWCISYPGFNLYQRFELVCVIEAFVLTTCFNLGIMYVAVLGIDLCLKFKFQGSIDYFKRSLLFNTVCISVNVMLLVFLVADGTVYVTEFNTCSISNFYSDIIELVLAGVCSFIMIFSLCYIVIKRKKNSKKIIKNFAFVILFVFLTWLVPSIFGLLSASIKSVYFDMSGYLIGTLSGTFVGLSRIFNYKVLRFFKKKTVRIQPIYKRPTLNSFTLDSIEKSLLNDSFFNKYQSVNDFSELYDNFSVKTFMEILCALSLNFYDKVDTMTELPQKKSTKTYKKSSDPNFKKNLIKYNIHSQSVTLIQYQQLAFESIRFHYSHSSQDIYKSISDPDNSSHLKSHLIINKSNGSMILITSDQKYVIKIISKQEKSVFLQILLDTYVNRVLECKDSKLVRILGLFQVKPAKVYFVIMENTAVLDAECLRFDLKGSTVDRYVENKADKIVLKDLNFIESRIKVRLEREEMEKILSVLNDDFEILRKVGIMDYSVYLVYYQNWYCQIYPHYAVGNCSVGVIDFFQLYDSRKAIERCLKIYGRCVKREKLSSVSHNEYFARINEFLKEVFVAK